MQPGMNFYSQLPDSYNLVVNTDHPLVARIKEDAVKAIGADVEKDFAALSEADAKIKAVNAEVKDNKPTDEQKAEIDAAQKSMGDSRKALADKAAEWGATQPLVRQIIDLALLASGLLKGKELSEFVKRSVSLL